MPVDAAVVQRLLAVARKNHAVVAFYRDLPRSELAAEPGRMLAIQHGLQLAIQALVGEGILSFDQGENLQSMVGLCNIIVHGYAELDEGRLLELVDHRLNDLLEIAGAIETNLKSRGVL